MVSISSCSVEFQEASPGFGSSSSFHRNEFSSSGNTDDFIREVTESHNVSYNMLTKMNSEDEISSPFSLSSSRHSLLIVESDPDHDGSESPDQLESPQEVKEKESRPSYSILSCPISHSLTVSEKLTASPEREVELVPTSVLITPSDDEEPLSKSSTHKPPPLLVRQSALLEPDQSDLLRLTPTNLSVSQASYYDNLSSPTTPTPESEVKTGGEPSEGQSTTEPDDDLENLIDEIMGGSDGVRIRAPVPTRRHSNCNPASRGELSLVPLYQRRTSLTALPSLTPLTSCTLRPPVEDVRKLSDPAVCLRKERVKNSYMTRQKRCLSDSDPPNFSTEEDDCKSEGCGSSALDSGYHDSRFQDSSSIYYPPSSRVSLDNFSDDFMELPLVSPSKSRRPTPFSPFAPKTDGHNNVIWPWEESSQPSSHGNPVPAQPAKRSVPGRQSQSSVATSSENMSLGSFWESQMSQVSAVDLLSSLGFDDFGSPQLIPDRFIPKDLEQAKPSLMQGTSMPSLDDDESVYISRPASICSMSESSVSSSQPPLRPLTTGTHDLPLGATAENFAAPNSPPPQPTQSATLEKLPSSNVTSQSTGYQYRFNTVLETVPEETASDLSPSPRWLSPRVSVDHSVLDFAAGNLGASLNVQKVRKRSLPTQREGYKLSVGSLVESETGDSSIHVSVTSYDDEMALEKEREKEESSVPIPVEDCSMQRRARRKGVYVPPASLLTWLNSQEPISEEVQNPEELPWPFNEQAKLRVSLTEIQLERKASETTDDGLTSPILDKRLLCEPVCNILDSSRSSPSLEPHGRLSLSSLGSHDLERSCSPDDNRSNIHENTLVLPSLKRRSRSLSPIIPPREETIRKATGRISQTTDDIQLGTAGQRTLSHVRVITHEDRDYKNECTWLRSALNSQEARAHSTETSLRAEVDSLQSKLCATEKQLTRQTAIYQDLQQESESARRQLKEAKRNHNAALVSLRAETRQVSIKEQQALKNKFAEEKASALSLAKEKYVKELNNLKKALQAKTTELHQLTAQLAERSEAYTALTTELKDVKKQTELREARLSARLEEERGRLERSFSQEKESALGKLQEQHVADRQRELTTLRDKLIGEKNAAISILEQKHSEEVSKLHLQLQETREQSEKEVLRLSEVMEREVLEERQKIEQAKQLISVLKQDLEKVQIQAKAAERNQYASQESQRPGEEDQRYVSSAEVGEWSKAIDALDQRHLRAHSTGNIPTINATEEALLGLKLSNDTLKEQVSELKKQLEREKRVGLSAHRDKIVELHRLRAISQMDKQIALNALAEKLKQASAEKKKQPFVRAQQKATVSEENSKDKKEHCRAIARLERELKTQQHVNKRIHFLYEEKCQEVNSLQASTKQLAKEHLLLERVMGESILCSVQDH